MKRSTGYGDIPFYEPGYVPTRDRITDIPCARRGTQLYPQHEERSAETDTDTQSCDEADEEGDEADWIEDDTAWEIFEDDDDDSDD